MFEYQYMCFRFEMFVQLRIVRESMKHVFHVVAGNTHNAVLL